MKRDKVALIHLDSQFNHFYEKKKKKKEYIHYYVKLMDLKKEFSKDDFLLPKIDVLIDAVTTMSILFLGWLL